MVLQVKGNIFVYTGYLFCWPDGMAERLRREINEPRVPGLNPDQVTDCPTTLPGLGGYPVRPI